jgi:uncharacterized protein (DUF433 family)
MEEVEGYHSSWNGADFYRVYVHPINTKPRKCRLIGESRMDLDLLPEIPPITTDIDGVARVADTRVTLKTVVEAFAMRSETPERIAEGFRLSLGDVYSVIGFWLRHRRQVDAYLDELRQREEDWRLVMEAQGRIPNNWREGLRKRAESHTGN